MDRRTVETSAAAPAGVDLVVTAVAKGETPTPLAYAGIAAKAEGPHRCRTAREAVVVGRAWQENEHSLSRRGVGPQWVDVRGVPRSANTGLNGRVGSSSAEAAASDAGVADAQCLCPRPFD